MIELDGTGIAAIIAAMTGFLGLCGKGAWIMFRHWEQRQVAKEDVRAKEARKALASKNRELNAIKRKLAECEKRVAAS